MSHVSRSITGRSVQFFSRIVAGAITAAILVAPVSAQQLTGTLKKIKDTGTFHTRLPRVVHSFRLL